MVHAYVQFRFHLARHGLRQFFASLQSSAEILLLVGANVVLGLLALSAFPPMYAVSLAPLDGAGVLLAHAFIMSAPVALLRKRVLPADAVRWAHRLPIPAAVQLRADALVAGLLAGPLALLYAVSAAILLAQHPAWLDPLPALGATLLSWLLTWCCAIAVLALRSRRPAGARWQHGQAAQARSYTGGGRRPRLLLLWHRLFWLPYWRLENVVGWQQSVLLGAAMTSAVLWMQTPSPFMRAVLALATAALMVVLTDRGDKAVREQVALLRPVMASWPLRPRGLFALARLFAAAPAFLVLLAVVFGGAVHGVWGHRAGHIYLVLASAAPLLLVATPVSNQRARVALVVIQILLLTAVGSELWT
ncbi:MAG: hypothetical protein V4484_22025 [Pseudomonadota bacterium]